MVLDVIAAAVEVLGALFIGWCLSSAFLQWSERRARAKRNHLEDVTK